MTWAQDAREVCSGLPGIVCEGSDAHGLTFKVKHCNGDFAWWEAEELRPAPTPPIPADV